MLSLFLNCLTRSPVWRLIAITLLLALGGAAHAAQVNIEFDGLPANQNTFPTPNYQEGGFTMTGQNLDGSNILPGVVEAIVVPTSPINGASGALEITETDASSFEFISLLLAASGSGPGPVTLTVTGYAGAAVVGTDTFTLIGGDPNTTFAAVNLAGRSINRLTIQLANQTTGTGTLVPQLFSIRLENAPPPPPQTTATIPTLSEWGLIIFSILLALSMWRRGPMRLSGRR